MMRLMTTAPRKPATLAMAKKPAAAMAKKPAAAMAKKPATAKTIAELVAGDKRFTTLLAALQKAELVSNLKEGKTLSVFAPTDDAFAKLGVQLDALDPATLKKILLHHIVPGKVRASALRPLTKVKSLGGTHLATSDIKLVQSDVAADGFVHVVSKVLLPPM